MAEQTALSLKKIRLLIILGTMLLAGFMVADIALLPNNLTDIYLKSRLYMQFPICGLFLLASFHPLFLKNYQNILCGVMLSLVFINYWLIITCWQLEEFSFPYEGTMMYSLFTLFVFRLPFKTGVFFSSVVVVSFGLIVLIYPIYGEQNTVNLGFVFIASIVGLIGVHQVESALKKLSSANLSLELLSQTDHLTNIYNRRTYEIKFAEQLSLHSRLGNAICIFVIDLDYFKDYNDGYGHLQGDHVIKLQAKHLSSIFRRESDIVARYGGEEFVVVASQLTHEQCIRFANDILEQWSLTKVEHGKGKAGKFITCSVGFYLTKVTKDTDKGTMFERADQALYQAKSEGRNRFVEYQTTGFQAIE